MKILAVGRNYLEHIKELNNERSKDPVIFLMPDTALLRENQDFYHPDFSNNIHYELELVIKIDRMGKNISEKFAHKYYSEIGLGIDFTARDLQSKAKENGLPWDIAKGFNHSAPISTFVDKTDYDLDNVNFRLIVDGKEVQNGNSSMMIFSIDYIVSYLSQYYTLKKGDLIFTGTPAGVGKVEIGNRLEAFLEDKKLMDFEVK